MEALPGYACISAILSERTIKKGNRRHVSVSDPSCTTGMRRELCSCEYDVDSDLFHRFCRKGLNGSVFRSLAFSREVLPARGHEFRVLFDHQLNIEDSGKRQPSPMIAAQVECIRLHL